jgi:hypothetical protein
MVGKTKIIGITGQARSGKDTLGAFLVSAAFHSRMSCRRYAFADGLKQMYAAALEGSMPGWMSDNDVIPAAVQQIALQTVPLLLERHSYLRGVPFDIECEDSKVTHRENLIALGLHMRDIDPLFWVRPVLSSIESDAPDVAVVTDVRFPNEADVIDILVRVVRPSTPLIVDSEGRVNPSEVFALSGRYDLLVDNSIDLTFMEANAYWVLDHLPEVSG